MEYRKFRDVRSYLHTTDSMNVHSNGENLAHLARSGSAVLLTLVLAMAFIVYVQLTDDESVHLEQVSLGRSCISVSCHAVYFHGMCQVEDGSFANGLDISYRVLRFPNFPPDESILGHPPLQGTGAPRMIPMGFFTMQFLNVPLLLSYIFWRRLTFITN